MKWYKRFSDFHYLPGVQNIKNQLGFEGLGRLDYLMEMIAQRMKACNNYEPQLVISEKQLAQLWGTKRDVVTKILTSCAQHLEIFWKTSDNIITIKYPKMLELKDSRKKKVPQIPRKGAQVDIRYKNKDNIYTQQIENAYLKYPRKEGKAKGIKNITKQINSDNDIIDFEKAVDNYAALCKKENTELKYIKHFSTFTNPLTWKEYVTIDAAQEKREVWDFE